MLEQFLSKYLSTEEQQQKLEELAAAHPYFTPAQFHLLLNNIANGESPDELAAKNAVLFNNPLWLNFQVQQYSKKEVADTEITVDHPAAITGPPDEQFPTAPAEEPPAEIDTEEEAAVSIAATAELRADAPLLRDILSQPASAFPDELPAFQPLYSSDYFASQGIKLSDEIQSSDKLGKQLKSFTEWLKGMKKLHPEKLEEKMNERPADASVQSQAEESNSKDTVLTEAMAEVLALQGKADKAAEIYHKLSLLNPSKSAYFAAKIEKLKGT